MQRKIQQPLLYLIAGILLISVVPWIVLAAPPEQEEVMCATEYIVQAGDSLSKIAEKYLGDKLAYPTIVQATNQKNAADDTFAKITDPDILEIGWKLCLPEVETVSLPEPDITTEGEVGMAEAGWAPDSFATDAFPPPFPVDSRHTDAWYNEQCQTCHEKQIDNAPAIPHDVWTQNCRSCHVPSTQALEPAIAEWGPASFASGAFPPPFPVDSRHTDAWYNEQCQTCHEKQIDNAPAIPHDVWTQNCRSCHVPEAQETE